MDVQEGHNDNTLYRVYAALMNSGLSHQQSTDAISSMQTYGILFRERVYVNAGKE